MKTLKESILSDVETTIERGTNIVDKVSFLTALGDLIDVDMNEYPEKWDAFIDVLNNQCKPIKSFECLLSYDEVIIAYKENFKISNKYVGSKTNDGVGTLLIIFGSNVPICVRINTFYKHDLRAGNSIFTMKKSSIITSHNITDYNRFLRTTKKMNLYKISGDVANKIIELSRYNNWRDKPYW